MEGLQYSVTTKGKAAVVYLGYKYRVKKSVGTTVYWQCLEPGCLGRLKTNAIGVTPGGQHTHPPFCGRSMRPPGPAFAMRLGKHAQRSTLRIRRIYESNKVSVMGKGHLVVIGAFIILVPF
jgi:hypothetical protein